MNLIQKITQSIRFWSNMRYKKQVINPEIRELLEDYYQKKRIKVNQSLEEEKKQIKNLQETYEYKCFEHYRKIDFLKTKEDSAEFLKYCNFEIFYDKKRWTRSIFYFRHFHTPKDFILTKFKKLILLLITLFAFKLGLINGSKDSQLFDEIKENIVDVRTEDQLLALLNTRRIPVMVLYYLPGDIIAFDMQKAQGKFIENWGEDYVTMAKVNCKYNLDLCIKKVSYMNFPQWELMYPPFMEEAQNGEEVKRFPVVPSKFNRSYEGLEGFLSEQGLIPDKYNPVYIVNKSMRKYI